MRAFVRCAGSQEIVVVKGTLRSKRQFTEVYDSGLKAVGRHVVAFALSPTSAPTDVRERSAAPGDARGVAVGIVASRKVGNAVARNRAKRVLRAAFAPLRSRLKEHSRVVLVARRSIIEDRVAPAVVEAELAEILTSLGLMTKEGS